MSTAFTAAQGLFLLRAEPPLSVTLTFTQVSRKDGLTGLLRVETPHATVRTTDGVVWLGRVNLLAPQTVKQTAEAITAAFDTVESDAQLPVKQWLRELAIRTERALSVGPAPLVSTDVGPPAPLRYTALPGPLVVLDKLPMLICGDGEVGKSTLGVWIAGHLAAHGHRVLYLDWEEGADDWTDKMHRLFPGSDMPVVYYHEARRYGPIWDQREALQTQVRTFGITYVVVDSVAAAIAGSDGPESAANAARYFGEVAALGEVGSLHLAHVVKAVREDEGRSRKKPTAFGSVFWSNFVRLSYFADTDDEGLSDTRTVALYRTKCNRLAKARVPHIALAFTYDDTVENGGITVTPTPLADHAALNQRLSFTQRILSGWTSGTRTTSDIGARVGVDPTDPDARGTLRKALSLLAKQGRLINLEQSSGRHEGRWALVSDRQPP